MLPVRKQYVRLNELERARVVRVRKMRLIGRPLSSPDALICGPCLFHQTLGNFSDRKHSSFSPSDVKAGGVREDVGLHIPKRNVLERLKGQHALPKGWQFLWPE